MVGSGGWMILGGVLAVRGDREAKPPATPTTASHMAAGATVSTALEHEYAGKVSFLMLHVTAAHGDAG